MSQTPQKIGLILTGGGARAAYQVGVLKAIAEFMPRRARNPFQVICGTSAGALNAVTLAVNAQHFRKGVKYLLGIWTNAHVSDIYRSDALGVLKNSSRWVAGLVLSLIGINRMHHISLLDNAPLAKFLEQALPCDKIQENIDAGALHALSITASGYGSGHSVTFYQGIPGIQPWKRARRLGVEAKIGIEHLLASSAIPFIFPAVRIHREYFGDGSVRQIAPISSALHLGADKVLLMGAWHADDEEGRRHRMDTYPTLAQIAGHALDSIFLDGLEVDLERLERINKTVSLIPEELRQATNMRHVDVLVITPSQPLEKVAERHIQRLPWAIRLLLRSAGVMRRSGANLVSYLLFDKYYCQALIDLGYQDALKRREEILEFLGYDLPASGCDMPQ
ncbi:patatin-like phospholipase family protein [Sideroxydans sp. CL21]|uniref:patatin-like phospholipase family protein n=1 Tax=Sideroxydans sp. CL21 TaxID=2600596 RepID=UPI0024BC00FA|nr:patatin-like phospholipase family protein [Sideroxydans sp. CL21]